MVVVAEQADAITAITVIMIKYGLKSSYDRADFDWCAAKNSEFMQGMQLPGGVLVSPMQNDDDPFIVLTETKFTTAPATGGCRSTLSYKEAERQRPGYAHRERKREREEKKTQREQVCKEESALGSATSAPTTKSCLLVRYRTLQVCKMN